MELSKMENLMVKDCTKIINFSIRMKDFGLTVLSKEKESKRLN